MLRPTPSSFPLVHLLQIHTTSGSFLLEAQMKFVSISFYREEKQQESTFWLLNLIVISCRLTQPLTALQVLHATTVKTESRRQARHPTRLDILQWHTVSHFIWPIITPALPLAHWFGLTSVSFCFFPLSSSFFLAFLYFPFLSLLLFLFTALFTYLSLWLHVFFFSLFCGWHRTSSPLSSLSLFFTCPLSVQINLSFSVFWSIQTLSTTSSSRFTLYIPTSAWTHSLP